MAKFFQIGWAAILLVLGLAIGLTGVSYSVMSRGQAPLAAQLYVAEGEANSKLAHAMARAQEYSEAEKFSRLALNRSLADVQSVRSIALAAEQRDSPEEFRTLLNAAGKLSWRDTPTQAKLFEQRLIEQDYLGAIDNADAMMRKRDATDELIEIFIVASLDDTLIGPIADKLAAQPTWRGSFFANAKLPNSAYYRSFSGLMKELNMRGDAASVTREELSPVVYTLNRSKRLSQGIDLWHSLFPQDNIVLGAGQAKPLPWKTQPNSDKPLPFDWFVPSNARSYARITATSVNSGDRSLEVDPNPRAVGTVATKTVRLPAGSFEISVTVPDGQEGALDRIFWTVKCDGKGDRTPLPLAQGSKSTWRGSVGSCGAVQLELSLREADRRDRETILVDEVTVKAGA